MNTTRKIKEVLTKFSSWASENALWSQERVIKWSLECDNPTGDCIEHHFRCFIPHSVKSGDETERSLTDAIKNATDDLFAKTQHDKIPEHTQRAIVQSLQQTIANFDAKKVKIEQDQSGWEGTETYFKDRGQTYCIRNAVPSRERLSIETPEKSIETPENERVKEWLDKVELGAPSEQPPSRSSEDMQPGRQEQDQLSQERECQSSRVDLMMPSPLSFQPCSADHENNQSSSPSSEKASLPTDDFGSSSSLEVDHVALSAEDCHGGSENKVSSRQTHRSSSLGRTISIRSGDSVCEKDTLPVVF